MSIITLNVFPGAYTFVIIIFKNIFVKFKKYIQITKMSIIIPTPSSSLELLWDESYLNLMSIEFDIEELQKTIDKTEKFKSKLLKKFQTKDELRYYCAYNLLNKRIQMALMTRRDLQMKKQQQEIKILQIQLLQSSEHFSNSCSSNEIFGLNYSVVNADNNNNGTFSTERIMDEDLSQLDEILIELSDFARSVDTS